MTKKLDDIEIEIKKPESFLITNDKKIEKLTCNHEIGRCLGHCEIKKVKTLR